MTVDDFDEIGDAAEVVFRHRLAGQPFDHDRDGRVRLVLSKCQERPIRPTTTAVCTWENMTSRCVKALPRYRKDGNVGRQTPDRTTGKRWVDANANFTGMPSGTGLELAIVSRCHTYKS